MSLLLRPIQELIWESSVERASTSKRHKARPFQAHYIHTIKCIHYTKESYIVREEGS